MADRPKQRGPSRHNRQNRRCGAVLVVVLVCLAVATALFVSAVKMAAADRLATRTEQWRIQAAWLAESAVERAVWRLNSDDTYAGETWGVTTDESGSADPGSVKIDIEAVPDRPELRLVRVRADYPNHAKHRARQSKQVVVQIPAATGAAGGATESTSPKEQEP